MGASALGRRVWIGGAGTSRPTIDAMSRRARSHVMSAVAAIFGGLYGWISLGWSDAAFYGGGAGLIAVIVLAGLPWMEFAPDGAFRRRPQS
jgi:hypothetical protein